eukprot:459013-Rhodomonas_salina.1
MVGRTPTQFCSLIRISNTLRPRHGDARVLLERGCDTSFPTTNRISSAAVASLLRQESHH